MLIDDLQEAFYLVFGPFIISVILPIFTANAIVLAGLMAVDRFWRPLEHIRIARSERSD